MRCVAPGSSAEQGSSRRSTSFNRFTERKKVLLPQPDGPIRAVTARRGMATVTSNNAWVGPYQKLYVRTSRMGDGRSERRTDLSPWPPLRVAERGNGGEDSCPTVGIRTSP